MMLSADAGAKRTFRTPWVRGERVSLQARATAVAVVLVRGRRHSFDSREHAERYAAQVGGQLALPDTAADRDCG